ncbi:MAG: hypothetical protein ACK4YF_01550 [Exilispira sp.]
MKKLSKISLILALILFISINTLASTSNSNYLVTFGGINGYMICPTALPVPAGSFNINVGWVFSNPNYLPIGIAFSFIKNWEIGFGHQFVLSSSTVATPFLISTKYRFLEGKMDLSLGAVLQIYEPANSVEIYASFHSGSIFGKGMMDIVIGKTIYFNQGIDSSINFYIGTLIPLIGDVFFLMVDFSNNALGNMAGYMSLNRGIFNVALIFDIIPKILSIYISSYDFMDSPFSTIGIGIDWKLSLK